MKKSRLFLLPLCLFMLTTTSCGEQVPVDQKESIYNMYRASGGELSYEEWLESIRGENGSTILFGEGVPTVNLGKTGDEYLDTSTWDVYCKNTSGWKKIGNIMGKEGVPGKDGSTPYIGDNGNWWIGNEDTGYKAEGSQGNPGHTPEIKIVDGYWYIDGVSSGVKAEGSQGEAGHAPIISIVNGYWTIDGVSTGVYAKGDQGETGVSVVSTVINSEGELIVAFSNGDEFNAGKVVFTEHIHEYESTIINPTCTTDGSVTFTCKTCGHIEYVVNKTQGHIFEAWREIVPASCTNEGKKVRYCNICGLREEEVIEKHDHKLSESYAFNSATHWHYCELCGVVVDEENHLFEDLTCSICEYQKSGAIADDGMIYSLNENEGSYTLLDYGSSTELDVVIPEMHNGKPVTAIGDNAFLNTKIVSISMPNSIVSVGKNCFWQCKELETVSLSKNIKRIEKDTFSSCEKLVNISIPDGVEYIGDGAFWSCSSIVNLIIPNSVKEIGSICFECCTSLQKITIPSSIQTLGSSVFNFCSNLSEVIILNGCLVLGHEMFNHCRKLISIYIPKSIRLIGRSVFQYCNNLTSVFFADPYNWYEDDVLINSELLLNENSAARKLMMSSGIWTHKTEE